MPAKCSMCHGSGFVTSRTICDCKKLLEPPPRDWKPVVGEKVLVEAKIDEAWENREVCTLELQNMNGRKLFINVPLSSIRPKGR